MAAALPRPAERADLRYQWIARLLANPLVEYDTVMRPLAEEAIQHAGASGGTAVLILNQSRISARHEMLVLSVRVGEQHRVRRAEGVAAWLPAGGKFVLMGDRFYALGWDWRLRLKQNLLVFEPGGETTLAECLASGDDGLSGIELTEKQVATSIATVHEPGHPEPWIVAMSEVPNVRRAFDYGLRRGVDAMLSDFKTRGFGAEDSQIRHPNRLARLLLVIALALHWAVSIGMWATAHQPLPAEKGPGARPKKMARGRTSLFKRGLRRIQRFLQLLSPLPPLRSVWENRWSVRMAPAPVLRDSTTPSSISTL